MHINGVLTPDFFLRQKTFVLNENKRTNDLTFLEMLLKPEKLLQEFSTRTIDS